MTAAERRFWQRLQAKTATLTPEMAAAIVLAYRRLATELSIAELATLLRTWQVEAVVAQAFSDAKMADALAPVQEAIRTQIEEGARYHAKQLPATARPRTTGAIAVGFNVLDPNTIVAVRRLEDRVLSFLAADVRQSARQYMEDALREGIHPLTAARGLRDIIGLAPSRERFVANLRRELESGQYGKAGGRVLLDKRLNLANLDKLGATEQAARIDAIVGAYRKRWLAQDAATTAKAVTLSALKQGQALTWAAAVERGDVNGGRLMKEWVHFDPQPDPRPEHIYMASLPPVPYDMPYSNGDLYAGESDPYNCRCSDRYFLASPGAGDA